MWCKIRQSFSWLLLLGALVLLILLSLGTFNPTPATATISTIEEAPGQILSQSRHQLRDDKGNAWQVVLFKRVKGDVFPSINLRLVAFPGTANFAHPQSLQIITKNGNIFDAKDVFAEQAPSENVGEYNVNNILEKLPNAAAINLYLVMKDNQAIEFKIPAEVILEWQTIAHNE
ncbi:DUF3122 domain-containing protein [Brunnivagina elsteri]|uniref:DUF3122 domain-containing protein n=1 Tax=Brunnivagina elsteri CCALA 953 TaxID=987040 RepID=A0A2A2TJG3_9CYAN|nr:DUF3122 domain-containing protein [Calothrix elsteri]PAX55228.1 hypothetical protein CK510_11175 [Calothrix elsteri CCALA 953]